MFKNNKFLETHWSNMFKVIIFAFALITAFAHIGVVLVTALFFGLFLIYGSAPLQKGNGSYYCVHGKKIVGVIDARNQSGNLYPIPFFSKVIFVRDENFLQMKDIRSRSSFSPFHFDQAELFLNYYFENYQVFLDSEMHIVDFEESLRFALYRKLDNLESTAFGKVKTKTIESDLSFEMKKIANHYGISFKEFSFKDVSSK